MASIAVLLMVRPIVVVPPGEWLWNKSTYVDVL